MKNLRYSVLLLALLLSACTAQAPATPYPDEVPWEVALEILNRGEVEQLFQTHSLQVTLYLKDGVVVSTVEPSIDAIFAAVEACGSPCAEIAIATE